MSPAQPDRRGAEQLAVLDSWSRRSTFRSGADTRPGPPPEWPDEELRGLRDSVCSTVPHDDDPYWTSNDVWVGCVEINPLTTYEEGSAARNLQIKMRVISRGNAADVWRYYKSRDGELNSLLNATSGTRIRVIDTKISKGSVEIIIVISIGTAVLGLGLGSLILGLVQMIFSNDAVRTRIHDAAVDAAAFVQKLTYRIRDFFRGLGGGAPRPFPS
jgi:hypothetical protein